jgi:hypothetical protein
MKNFIHIISIISSVISIVVSILIYFGITRYIKIYSSKNVDKYIEQYSELPLAREKRTVILLSLESQDDLKNIFPTINSMLDQTVRVNQFFLVVPCSNDCDIDIPENLMKVVTIIKPGKIYDDKYQDIISILQREKEKETLIIKISKNIIYGKEFVENIIETSESNPDSVIKDESNLFFCLKPNFIKLDENLKIVEFNEDTKNISCENNYKII